MSIDERQQQTAINVQEKANLIWAIADKLVGVYKPHEYGNVILPMCVIKRFEDTLAPTREKVLETNKELEEKKIEMKRGFLERAVTRFEVFLKKVYYIKNHSEMVSTKPGQEGMKATLADCIFQTPCLKRLKYSESDADKKFGDYLNIVRDWRNDQAHKAPTATEEECDLAINVLTTMYLFVVAFGIRRRDLEQGETKYADMHEEHDLAAEPLHDE
ncbi:MAG: type I restriction-modification system subunit M N-terminal domain-containing protein [Prevotella sp.]|nr:type I restriction-modification system subunit M N-terminal domain-containing protein [Prevotella sp.]